MSQLLPTTATAATSSPPELLQNLCQFLVAEVLFQINALNYGMTSFKIVDAGDPADEAYLCQDLFIQPATSTAPITSTDLQTLSRIMEKSLTQENMELFPARQD